MSSSSCGRTSTLGSRNGDSSSEGEDSEVELMGSSVLCSSQRGFTGGGWWGMVVAYLMVAVDNMLVFCYTWPR